MNRPDAVNALIEIVYSSKKKMKISKKERKILEGYYKNNHSTYRSFRDFYDSAPDAIKAIMDKSKAVSAEIEKQLNKEMGLQSGIVAECIFVQTLAEMLGLRQFVDIEKTSLPALPKEISYFHNYIQEQANTACAVRYAYYKKGSTDSVLFQYGNPQSVGDATAVLCQNEIIIEIKDVPAVIMETEVLYDESGHLISTPVIKNSYPDYEDLINDFNKKTSVFDELGHNLPIFQEADTIVKQRILSAFVNETMIDVLMTTNKQEELLMIKRDDIMHVFSDGALLIDIKGSEIRTKSKNSKAVFTPEYLRKTLVSLDIDINLVNNGDDSKEVCVLMKDNEIIKLGNGRGLKETTRLRLGTSPFYIKTRDKQLEEYDDRYEFPIEIIKQNKVSFAVHINILKTKDYVQNELYS